MFPGKCGKCNGPTGKHYMMIKGNFTLEDFRKDRSKHEILPEVCEECKVQLEKEGWTVLMVGMH